MMKIRNFAQLNCDKIICPKCPSYSGIIAGESAGELWVDDQTCPSLALAYSYAVGGFAILGETDQLTVYEGFKGFLTENLFLDLKRKGMNYFEFSVESEVSKGRILNLFADRAIKNEKELSFRRDERYYDQIPLPAEFEVQRIDVQLINRLKYGHYQNGKSLERKILESWGSFGRFMDKSLGYVVTLENEIVADIIGTSRFENVLPIDIETESQQQKKGLASVLIRHFVNECAARGLTAQWDCVESNLASLACVKKADFRRLRENTVYWFAI